MGQVRGLGRPPATALEHVEVVRGNVVYSCGGLLSWRWYIYECFGQRQIAAHAAVERTRQTFEHIERHIDRALLQTKNERPVNPRFVSEFFLR